MQGKQGIEGERAAVAVCVTSLSVLSLCGLSLCHYHNHSDTTVHTAP